MAFNVISNITLDMKHAYSVSNIVQVNQYDTAGVIKAQLLNDGAKWLVPQDAKPVVMFKKTDNIGGFYDVTDTDPEIAAVSIDTDRSIIYISLDPQTTTTATSNGKYVDMQVAFFENGLRISTFAFYMQVLPSVITSGDLLPDKNKQFTSSWIFNILSKEIADTLTVATTPDAMTEWLEDKIGASIESGAYAIDDSLTVPRFAADAEATGKMVVVSDQNPNRTANKVWVKKTPATVQIPTVEELNELNRQISDVESDFDDIVIKSTNLYDQNAITNGYACKAGQTTGQAAGTDVVATHSISDWISVEPETSYIIWIDIETTSVNYRRQFADNSLNLVADFGTVTNGAAFITPAGCTKFRFSTATETMTTKKIQLEKGSQKTHYEDFGYTLKCDDELSLTSKTPVQNKVLTEEFIKVRNENVSVFQGVGRIEKFCHVNTQGNVVFDAEILIHGRNLYNSSTSTSGYAVKAGQLIGDQAETEIVASHSVSDWISVDPETTYILKETDGSASTYRVQFADIQHVLVANQGTIVNGTSFTTPAGCTQMRFSTATTTMTGKTQLEKGTTATEYEEYRTSFNPDYLTEILAMFNDPSIVRNSLAGKTAVFNGDSILELPYNWGKLMCEHFGIPYVHTGTDKTNFAIGGSTLTVWAGTGEAPRDRTPLIERYMDMPNNMDMVIISIGTNDWYYSWSDIGNRTDAWNVSFKGALNALLVGYTANSVTNEGLLDKYIGKNIIFVTPIKRDSNPNRTNSFGKTLEDYAEAIKDVCGYYGIPVIDMFHECPLNPSIPSQQAQFFDGSLNVAEGYSNLYNDDVHPNVFGSRVQARQAIGYMQAVYGWNVLND